MSYRGTADVTGLPELESVRRLREAGAIPQAPQPQQAQAPPPPKPKACANCGQPLNKMGECAHCGEASEASEGGPGSGPQGGKKKLPKFSGNPQEMKQVNPNPDTPRGRGRNTGPFKSGRGGFGR